MVTIKWQDLEKGVVKVQLKLVKPMFRNQFYEFALVPQARRSSVSPTVLYLWEFRDLPPSQGGEVRCACLSFFVFLFPSSGNMVEELELLQQKQTVTDEEEVSVNLGRECTRATKERGNNCLVMKVLSRRGIMLDALRKNIRM